MSIDRQTATIVPFPVGGRAGFVRGGYSQKSADRRLAVEAAPGFDWRGWYHGEAIRESEPADRH